MRVALVLLSKALLAAGELPTVVEGESNALTLRRLIFRTHDPFANLTLRPYSANNGAGGAGGSSFSNLYEQLIKELSPTLVIEVGVHRGSSTIKFAQLLSEQRGKASGGAVLAVDTWLGANDWWGDGRAYLSGPHVDESRKQVLLTGKLPRAMTDLLWVNGRPSIYQDFLSNVMQAGVQERVVPFPLPSRQVARFLMERGIQADLIHIDGSHEYEEVVDDLQHWWPLVRPGGVLLGDDYRFPDVKRAFGEMVHREGLRIDSKINRTWPSKVAVRKPHTEGFLSRLIRLG